MAYTSKWEPLLAACERAMTTGGISKEEAQSDLCQAIADGVVAIRVKLRKHASGMHSSHVLEGKDFESIATLKPEEFDWDRSRPVNPWFVKRGVYSPHGYWQIETIELSSTDVTNVLRRTTAPGGPVEAAGRDAGTAGRSGRAPDSHGGEPGRANPRSAGAGGLARRRGVRPQKFEQVCNAMRDDLREGRLTLAQLSDTLEKILADDYDVSRDTARRARNAVLAEFVENSISTNPDKRQMAP
jgi:hypothetical protein